MKNRKLLTALLLSALLLFVGFRQNSKPTQYEYKIQHDPSEKKLNELGAQGWEVVAGGTSGTASMPAAVFVLKRAK